MIDDAPFAQEFAEADRQAMIENTAQGVFNVLKDLKNQASLHARRWIWELLQNARDASLQGRGLRVNVSLTPDEFVFRHNGSPFTTDQMAHLIRHGSTKYQMEGQVGRFGTGFLSTHIISKVPAVAGLLADGRSFQFVLDRTGDSSTALTDSMNRSVTDFVTSVNGTPHTGWHTTEYRYPLTAESVSLAMKGVTSLGAFAPYVLAFNPQIEVIEIVRDGQCQTYRRGEGKRISDSCQIIPVWVRSNGSLDFSYRILMAASTSVFVAVMAQRTEAGTTIWFDASVPRFFMAFPMFGTESFAFPGIINSDAFRPKPERNGVYLGTEKTEDNQYNKHLVEAACVLMLETLRLSARRGWRGVSALCRVGAPADERGLDIAWLTRTTAHGLVEPIRNVPMVPVLNGPLAAPRSVWIPIGTPAVESSEVWELASKLSLSDTSLVEKASASLWAENLQLWVSALASSVEHMEESLTVAKLANRAKQAGSLAQLASMLRPDASAATWVDELFRLLHKAGLSSLFDRHPLIPDQCGTFRIRKNLATDGGIDEELKDIGDLLGEPLRIRLLHPDIHCAEVHKFLSTRTQEEAITGLLARLSSESKLSAPIAGFREANARMFAWLLRHERFDVLAAFPALTREPSVDGQAPQLAALSAEDQDTVPLAPPELWYESARPFVELFPQRHILASDYHTHCPEQDKWKRLASGGIVRLSPVFTKSEVVTTFKPNDMLDEEVDHQSKEPQATADIAFLRGKGGVMTAAGKSRTKSLLLLRFLMEHVVRSDQAWQQPGEAECQCGKKHKFVKASWIEPLRENRWVYVARNRSEQPSASALSKLTEGEPGIVRLLAGGEGTKFLEAVGVSAGDFLIQSVTGDDEETRVALSRSLVEMFQAVGEDAKQIQDLASEITSHPETIAELRERQQTRERVKRNQNIGKNVEEAFRHAFGEGHGLTVKRHPVGADYTVELDSDFLDELGREIVLEVGKFYVEIKATTVDHVRMTDVQAATAADHPERFVLCVVPLADPDAPITAEVVIDRARFVTDIGSRVRPLVEGLASLVASKQKVLSESGPVSLEMKGETVRYRVDQQVWEEGSTFTKVITAFGGIV